MTPFQRACIVAFWARLDHGESSPQYDEALRELAYERGAANRGANLCGRCRRPGHTIATCANLEEQS